jgi:hypothetical protein
MGVFPNFLPMLALNQDPSDLCLKSSWDYGPESLCPALEGKYFKGASKN